MTEVAAGVADLEGGRAALARGAWEEARALLDGPALADPREEADRQDLLGEALWWLGRLEACIEARQGAYAAYDALGDRRRAAQAAIWLYEHHVFQGRPAMGGGWLRRARRAIEGDTESTVWGNLLLREAEGAHGRGELAHALDSATTALELGRRLGSADLEAESLQAIGRLLIDLGRPAEGMAHLDEAMLLAVEGRLGPYATGKVYCSLVGACEDLGDLQRAAEWTEASARWSEQHPVAVFPGICRLKRAGVLQWRGAWDEAEREALRACEELADVKVGSAAAAWVEVGEIRRRLGDLDGAEAAFARAQELCCTPAAGLALLRLAQGRVDAAVAIVDGALADESWSRLARSRLLPARVQVALEACDLAGAREAADELDAIAADFGTAALLAAARLARGRVQLAEGSAAAACATLRRAVDLWHDLDVPYEMATAQLLLARACREAGDRHGESAAMRSATETFDRLGATFDARRARELAADRSLPCGLTEREAEVLRLVAAGRTNKEIASHLSLSQKTVARHLSNIFVKTGVTSRSAATAFAFERGLVGARS